MNSPSESTPLPQTSDSMSLESSWEFVSRASNSGRQGTMMTLRSSRLFSTTPDSGPAMNPNIQTSPSPSPTEAIYEDNLDETNFYGRFITLGYHQTSGPLENPLQTHLERNKTFELWRRKKANGWKFQVDGKSGRQVTSTLSSEARMKLREGSLGIPRSARTTTSIRMSSLDRPDSLVEYTLIPSEQHDLFQFGRDLTNNDFHLPGHTIEGRTW